MSIETEILIEQKVANNKKSKGIAYLLLIILGAFGAHRLYLECLPSALLLLVITLCSFIFPPLFAISVIWCFIDLFLIPSIVDKHINKLRQDARIEILKIGS